MAMTLTNSERTVTFEWNPDDYDIPKKYRRADFLKTSGGAGFSSFGLFIAGVKIRMTWAWMPADQFNELQTLLEDGLTITWDAGHAGATAYDVELARVNGKYFKNVHENMEYRRKVNADFIIIGESA